MEKNHFSLRICVIIGFILFFTGWAGAIETGNHSQNHSIDDLLSLSLEDLIHAKVTSVSRKPENSFTASAAICVITQEDITRSGYTSIAEILKMVPGLYVAQIDGNKFAVSSRGFNDRYANKLLVQIDGRTLYSTLHSGVYWEIQDYVLNDIERIEIIRGPGATMWGANAVNGIINIITKNAKDTQGLFLKAAGGNKVRSGDLRWGGLYTDHFAYRVYGKYIYRDTHQTISGDDAHDDLAIPRGGFRCDWNLTKNDSITLSGDYYNGFVSQDYSVASGNGFELTHFDTDVKGCNTTIHYDHVFSESSTLSLNAYYDRTDREDSKLEDQSNIFDIDLQHSFSLGTSHDLIWGLSYRHIDENTRKVGQTGFVPANPSLANYGAFVQDKITLKPEFLFLTIGSKFEDNYYTDFEFQPNARLIVTPDQNQSFWAAVSRAVRTPSIFENSILITVPMGNQNLILLDGNTDLDSEVLIAYEIGYRIRPTSSVTLDVAGFFNDYDKLGSTETTGLSSTFASRIHGEAYGGEVAASWICSKNVKLTAWYAYLNGNIRDKDTGEKIKFDTRPRHIAHLRSYINLPQNITWDTAFYYVDDNQLGNNDIDAYYRLDARFGWYPTKHIELSIAGQNLLVYQGGEFVDEHQEFKTIRPDSGLIERSVYAQIAFFW